MKQWEDLVDSANLPTKSVQTETQPGSDAQRNPPGEGTRQTLSPGEGSGDGDAFFSESEVSITRPEEKDVPRHSRKNLTIRECLSLLILPIVMLYLEWIARLHMFDRFFDDGFWYMTAAAASLGLLLGAGTMLLKGKARRVAYRVITGFLGVLFSFYNIYYQYFRMVFSWRMLGQATDAMQFWKDILVTILSVWYLIILFFLPLLLMCLAGRRFFDDKYRRNGLLAVIGLVLALIPYSLMMAGFHAERKKQISDGAAYYYTYLQNSLEQPVRYFGLANTARLEWKQILFGAPEEDLEYENVELPSLLSDSDISASDLPAREYGEHRMDLNFDATINAPDSDIYKKMDRYYASVTPTKENRYTGMFKGKNLIMITLEGFSYKAIDPDFTPVLYKMATQGFVFENFYTSSWVGSTASGEYANMTGNVYATSNCLKRLYNTYQPFALGNQFKALGYRTVAYHNNTFSYYSRHLSHPTLGYTYKAIGNGLVLEHDCWPRSDKEMAEATADEYIGTGQPFHAYYMSVSGHTRYTTLGNTMSKNHYNDLPEKYKDYPEEVKAYMACQYEVELMLEVLVDRLEKSGELEDTVFAMAADHYPYGLHDDSLAWLYGLEEEGIREQLPLYRDSFILWSASMKEPIVVTRPAGNVDILPTLSNLFGLEYDSRIMMGKDILSEGDHFAILMINGNCSWISTQGAYDGRTHIFTPDENCVLSGDDLTRYVDSMNKHIKNETFYSHQILNYNYYRHIFDASRQ